MNKDTTNTENQIAGDYCLGREATVWARAVWDRTTGRIRIEQMTPPNIERDGYMEGGSPFDYLPEQLTDEDTTVCRALNSLAAKLRALAFAQ